MPTDDREPDQEVAEHDAGAPSPDRWDAYPLFVLAIVVTVLLTTFGLGSQLWSLLSTGLFHPHH